MGVRDLHFGHVTVNWSPDVLQLRSGTKSKIDGRPEPSIWRFDARNFLINRAVEHYLRRLRLADPLADTDDE